MLASSRNCLGVEDPEGASKVTVTEKGSHTDNGMYTWPHYERQSPRGSRTELWVVLQRKTRGISATFPLQGAVVGNRIHLRDTTSATKSTAN